jgi:alpha-soluble NSF attachment protein
MFKMAKKWGAAGNAFCEAACLHAKAGSKHDAATNYVDAANCFKKSDPNGEICHYQYNCISVRLVS